MTAHRRMDWAALLRAGVQRLRLTPREFWALTPAELALMLRQSAGVAPMARDELDALLAAYPDEERSDE
ncbi:MAG: rcc01693 family protein [Cognatishimia activa]